METGTKERAGVVMMLRGHGEQRLRQAIMQGLVRDELIEDVEEVLRHFDDLERELASAKQRNQQLEKELGRFKGIYHSAILQVKRQEIRKRQIGFIGYLVAIGAAAFLIILACMMICRAVFG